MAKIKGKLILFLHFRIKIYAFSRFRIVWSLLELVLALVLWHMLRPTQSKQKCVFFLPHSPYSALWHTEG